VVVNRTNKTFCSLLTAKALLMALTTLFYAVPALGEPESADNTGQNTGDTLLMLTLENPPLAYTDEDGSVTGVLVQVIREAARRTGHEVEFRIDPWKRVIREVSEGNADAAFNAGVTEERKSWGMYGETVLIDETFVFFSRGPKALTRTLDEAASLRVGIQLGYYYGERFDQMLKDQPFHSVEVNQTIPRNLRLLGADRIDVFVGDLLPTLYYVKKLGLEDEISIVTERESGQPLVVSTSDTYVAFSRRSVDPAYVETFDKALQSVKASDTFDTILGSYQLNVPQLPE
jgi:polar amino acid transport system substrate-binding protein